MATGLSTPFASASAPVATIGGAPMPALPGKGLPAKKSSASELLDQIRQLEIEGNKLRSTNLETGSITSSGTDYGSYRSDTEMPGYSHGKPVIVPTSPATLSALVDISAEQKTISDLRPVKMTQLDAQRKETDRLQHHMLNDYPMSKHVPVQSSMIPSSPSKTGFSTLPSTELFAARRPTYEYGPPSHLEKALKDSQEQVTDLRRRLQEANDQSELQKRQFRSNIEELKGKLHETVTNREAVLDLRVKESANQETLLAKMQGQVHQLTEKCRAQEEALGDAGRQMDDNTRDKYLSDTALNQTRQILVDAERKRGRPFFDSDPASKQAPGMLVHTLERCMQEMSADITQKSQKIHELEKEILSLKHNISHDKETLIREQQDKLSKLGAYQSVLFTVGQDGQETISRGQFEQQMKMKDVMILDLEQKVRHLKEEFSDDRTKWQQKKETLEESLEKTHKEVSAMRKERDDAIRNHSSLEGKLEDHQNTAARLQAEVHLEKQRCSQMSDKETMMRTRQTELETKLEEKQRDVERLEKMLELIRHECNAQVNEKISYAERQERDRHLDQISSLTSQLSSMTEKCNRNTLDLEMTRSECANLKKQLRETSEKFESTKIQQESLSVEKNHVSNMLSDKKSEMERVTQEKDYYSNMLEQKNEELSQLKTQKERLAIQLEEKDKNLLMLQQQSSNFTQFMETNSRTHENLREEKDNLLKIITDQKSTLEELRSSRENMAKKMKIREKRVRELEETKKKSVDEIQLRLEEMGILQQEKDSLYQELKESRYEVANLTEEKDSVKHNLELQKSDLQQTLARAQSKCKAMEQEFKLAHRTLKSRESADHQAVKVADKMQKEVTLKRSEIDSLKTKVRWLEDKLDSLSRERNSLEGDKDRLKMSLNKSLTHNHQITADLEVSQGQVMELRTQINRLEVSLEKLKRSTTQDRKSVHVMMTETPLNVAKKANTKTATTQAQLEQFEQELTCLKLKHQLDMQEAIQKTTQRKGQGQKDPVAVYYPQEEGNLDLIKGGKSSQLTDRQIPTRDTDDYRGELKTLLHEMRTLISEKKDRNNHARPSLHRRYNSANVPVQTNIPAGHYRLYSSSETEEYHSDNEVDRTLNGSRSRSKFDYSGMSSMKGSRSRSLSPVHQYQRRHSLDTTAVTRSPHSYISRSPEFMRKSGSSRLGTYGNDLSQETESLAHQDNEVKPGSTRLVSNTQDLCKRLEERIESLSKMGGSLQKENKEMADLMKQQGKKIRKAKDNSKKIRKVVR
ncbi:coiled-coil domain-containing protein 158-like isoform X3 [Mizuhopecten yessoensis]|uniref:coiled-coil domain-containing protein 158-like isoform X3 n=1 Tax=Mizuhopecten yessoensis TaxID=6573 RepID=UPI000B45AC98|nr:coiled-coil domain-containing protein 158-like isoform X3 [Mizuhopecten yessoensis]